MSEAPIRLAVFASGRGSNAAAIRKYLHQHNTGLQLALIVSNKAEAPVLKLANEWRVPTHVCRKEELHDTHCERLLKRLKTAGIDFIALAGFLKKLPPAFVAAYRGRILNIHPSLLPKYGGRGMYGLHVHRAVLAANERRTGITIHEVNEAYDQGRPIKQKSLAIKPRFRKAEELAKRIARLEHKHYPVAIVAYAKKHLEWPLQTNPHGNS